MQRLTGRPIDAMSGNCGGLGATRTVGLATEPPISLPAVFQTWTVRVLKGFAPGSATRRRPDVTPPFQSAALGDAHRVGLPNHVPA